MQKIIPQTPENLIAGMNDLDNPKVLSANQWQLIENSFPGLTGKPRNGVNELICDTQNLGNASQPVIFRPHAASMIDPTGKIWVFVITECLGDSYLNQYAIEVWDPILGTRNVLESFQLSNDLCFFGFEKIYNGLYVVFDYGVTTNHTSSYRKTNMIIEWVSGAWAVRSMAVDANPTIAAITGSTSSATAGIANGLYVSTAITFVRITSSAGVNSQVFVEPVMESMEDLTLRQNIQITGSPYGKLVILMPSNYASAIAQGATHMRVWRTLGNASLTIAQGLSLRFLVDIALTGVFNPSTPWTDSTSDASLTGQTNVLNTTGYIIPPQGRYIKWVSQAGVLFIGGNPNNSGYWFYSSLPLNTATPQKYASMFNGMTQYFSMDPKDGQHDTGIEILNGSLYFFKERKVFTLDNCSLQNPPRMICSSIGCICPQSLVRAYIPQLGGECLLFISESGPAYLSSSGQVELLTQFRLAELWPDNPGIIQIFNGIPTDWYSRNKVVSAYWNSAWYIAYGDSEDPQTFFSGFQVTDMAGNLVYDEAGNPVLSQGSTFAMVGFKFGNDGVSLGGFRVTFPPQKVNNDSFSIFEPQALIVLDNIRIYAFSHKKAASGNNVYRLVNMFDHSKWQDTYLSEGAIPYSMAFRSRYCYSGPNRWNRAQLKALVCHIYFQDTGDLIITIFCDGTRLTVPCTYKQQRQSGAASDNTFRHYVAVLPHTDDIFGDFFDFLLSKVVPVDGKVEFFDGEFLIDTISTKDWEFLSGTDLPTGSTEFVVQADASPEVNAHT